ncbi:MAG: peptidase M50 [Gammaproteobacteria bacterium]|nr:peptidase M50 [Gammaproteobacteria bacterium]
MNRQNPSQIWPQIKQLQPRLRSHTEWHRLEYRGNNWFLLQDRATNRHYHFTESAYHFLNRLDGKSSVEQALSSIPEEADGTPVPQQEVVDLLLRLQSADLLIQSGKNDSERLYGQWRKLRTKSRLAMLMRPLAVRLPLFDPTPLLQKLLPLSKYLFHWSALLLWAGLVSLAALLGLQHGAVLADHAEARFLDPANLLLLWIAYPLVKGLHELGHGLAIQRWGGKVHELGIMLLVFVPVPYVEASAATTFPSKYRRILVGAAGVMIELLLASLALLVWLSVQPGWVRDLAFDITVIGGVSALLFNGNPLLRFDGYYVFCDLLEIPNLASRSQRYYSYLGRRYLLGLNDTLSPVVAHGEPGWFLFYGAASYAYRVFISLVIALYVAGKFFLIGTLLAAWVLLSQLLLPIFRLLRFLFTAGELQDKRSRGLILASALISVTAALVLLLPLPSNTLAEGVVRLPQNAIILAGESGEVTTLLRRDGDQIKAGDPLIRMQEPSLSTRAKVLAARAEELRARIEREHMRDRVEAAIQREQLAEVENEINELNRRLAALTLISPAGGELELIQQTDLPGRYLEKGSVLGLVHDTSGMVASVVIPQADAGLVHRDTQGLSVRFPGRPESESPAQLVADVPSGSYQLPSPALGSMAGGRIAVDTRDERGITTLEPIFQYDVRLPESGFRHIPGARIQVRFEHSPETLASRWYRSARQLLLARLGS